MAVSAGVLVTWVFVDYAMIRFQIQDMAQLERENEEQRLELLQLSGRVMKVVNELDEIQAIDGDDDIILKMEEAFDDIQVQHLNDAGSDGGVPDRVASLRYDHLAGHMLSVLAYVDHEIVGGGYKGKRVARKVGGAVKKASGSRSGSATAVARVGSPESIMKKLRSISIELGLAPRLALSMAKVESGFDPTAVSPKGAIGVLQLIPYFVCQEYEVSPEMLFDPEINIRIGLSYMKSLLRRFDENLDLSLAAYNAGPRRVVEAGYSIPAIEETQEYVKKVKEAMRRKMPGFSSEPSDRRQSPPEKEPS
jgi:hypothetical protein